MAVDQIYRELILYDLDATVVLVPSAGYNEGQSGDSLVIERVTGHLSLQGMVICVPLRHGD